MVSEAFKTYSLHSSQDLLKEITFGRASEDAAGFERKFFERFNANKWEWKIISDFTSLFHFVQLDRRFPLDGRFPFGVDLELSYHVFWLMGHDFDITAKLIEKVRRFVLRDKNNDLAFY